MFILCLDILTPNGGLKPELLEAAHKKADVPLDKCHGHSDYSIVTFIGACMNYQADRLLG
ncbi:MAG: hypothetical protein ISR45_10530 [Rhodospirillales bacterium]|nr:hypothetical protein [Rhodospirillales bacterium]